MQVYTETTDGSFIEPKESALVWHHQYADHDFGSCQAKELLSHLESVLVNEPVVVRRGHQIVEVKPQVLFYFVYIMNSIFLFVLLLSLCLHSSRIIYLELSPRLGVIWCIL